jgi:hypothetical protein
VHRPKCESAPAELQRNLPRSSAGLCRYLALRSFVARQLFVTGLLLLPGTTSDLANDPRCRRAQAQHQKLGVGE